ncbi:uncharacterized protein [Montipora capricornis]|uniref:uncharacterized protein n=1 Tax=Montipora capricornis TaxID=246305 RepID=UPI0035F16745
MRRWISQREERGVFHQLIKELEVGDVVAYKEFFRMTKEQFCFLLGKVSPLIQKKRKLVFCVRCVRHKVELESTFRNTSLQLATWYFVARRVGHAGGNTRNREFQLALQQCCKTS